MILYKILLLPTDIFKIECVKFQQVHILMIYVEHTKDVPLILFMQFITL